MLKRKVEIDFDKPISQKEIDLFKDTLYLYDLEFLGSITSHNITGILQSTGMFNLIKAPLIKALDQSGLNRHVISINIIA